MPKSTRSSATTRNTPTPTATDQMITGLGMEGTWLASTCRSGSEMVTMMPIRKPTNATTHSLRDLVIAAPRRSPSGVMNRSAPSVNRHMPRMSIAAPMRKAVSVATGMGDTLKHSSSTMSVTGATDVRASENFSRMTLRC